MFETVAPAYHYDDLYDHDVHYVHQPVHHYDYDVHHYESGHPEYYYDHAEYGQPMHHSYDMANKEIEENFDNAHVASNSRG